PMTYMNPVLTIGTQVTEGIMAHGKCSRREAWQKGVELLRTVGIPSPEKRMKQYPYEFSGGMRQRIIIAMALSCHPRLLIADEPTTALDVTVQAQILALIRNRAREEGTSVIMITHDLGVVASLCDRIAILYGGKIVETGTTDEIFYAPKHPYTKGLLGSIARRQARPDGSFTREPIQSIPGTPPDLLRINTGCPFVSRCPDAMRICKDYLPAMADFTPSHAACCWAYCREQAQTLVEEQDRKRGEGRG
ncbi:MAG: ABC transporter ATP-binding protein, partial [Aristaeellaceae bacterium]